MVPFSTVPLLVPPHFPLSNNLIAGCADWNSIWLRKGRKSNFWFSSARRRWVSQARQSMPAKIVLLTFDPKLADVKIIWKRPNFSVHKPSDDMMGQLGNCVSRGYRSEWKEKRWTKSSRDYIKENSLVATKAYHAVLLRQLVLEGHRY